MTGEARLIALRLQGFKSFAERTHIEFSPGINAVVGPNGSGKSNLADALRWALGEQGRAIRSRKSEDVVFAGSERRSALGMADVTLVLDNADGLLPVDFSVVELGRRLYRSGENDYLVNRQRVRLRDLVDLLDAAHLADNAFLFIGQGMVDQALALRPEERRPLFEEVAGVRRHERRRRRAEEQLAEATVNLDRVEDILGELRPQARRLAAQAEQQTSRARAGEELAQALVAAFGQRWHAAASRVRATADTLGIARASTTSALEALQAAEAGAVDAARDLGARAELEIERRVSHESARVELAGLQLEAARAAVEAEGIARDRGRLAADRVAAEADLAARRRDMALPVPEALPTDDDEVASLERALAEGRMELAELRMASTAESAVDSAAVDALWREAAARAGELDEIRRRLAEVDRRLAEERSAAEAAERRAAELGAAHLARREAALAARGAEEAARQARESARAVGVAQEAARAAAAEDAAGAAGRSAALRGRLEALRARLADDESRGIGRAARRLGGTALVAGLDVEPALRLAASAALGGLAGSFILPRSALEALEGERGLVVLADAIGPGATEPPAAELAEVRGQAAGVGGGLLADAVRTDPSGVARRLLARTAWVPLLSEAIALATALPPGWQAVSRTGAAVASAGTVRLGIADAPLQRRAEADAVERDLGLAEAEATAARDRRASAEHAAAAARQALETARGQEAEAAAGRSAADDAERRTGRDAEQAARDAGWHVTRVERVAAERANLAERLAGLEVAETARSGGDGGAAVLGRSGAVGSAGQAPPTDASIRHAPMDRRGAIAAWEARLDELRDQRDRLAAARSTRDAAQRSAEATRARAEAAAALNEERISRVDAELTALANRERGQSQGAETREIALAAASEREAATRGALEAVRREDAADRARLAAAEATVGAAREMLQGTESAHRAAEVRELETRLALDAMREQALVEFAALGTVGVRALEDVAPAAATAQGKCAAPADAAAADGARPMTDERPEEASADEEVEAVAAALARAGESWAAAPSAMAPPSAGRLAALRRRFHELGAANPFAVEEYAELRGRLEGLQTQRADLVRAIEKTRSLIGELDGLIARQFRATFAALESAFDRRFGQLFGGGYARLALTDPADLATTGVEIVARPPGKKAQALAMLSGGERALTAVALLFAMLEVRPVPFCVLDEVDAALDEANVGRFAEALRGLAQQTQVIIITHNRGTIEAADALYGVTVGDDAVSRVVSLRIEEAAAIAEQVRGERGRPSSAAPAATAG